MIDAEMEQKRAAWWKNVHTPWERLMVRQDLHTILLILILSALLVLCLAAWWWLDVNNFPSQLLQALKNCRAIGAIEVG